MEINEMGSPAPQQEQAPQAVSNEAPATQEPAQHEEPARQEPSAHPEEGEIRLVEDERTGRKRVVTVPKSAPVEEEPKPEPQKPSGPVITPPEPPKNPITQSIEAMNNGGNNQPVANQAQVQAPQYYKTDELLLAMQLKSVDESRIPPNLRAQYEAIKKQNEPPQPTPEEAEKAVRQKIDELAREEAMKKTGATDDDLQLGEFSDDESVQARVRDYKIAYDLARERIIKGSLNRYAQMQAETKNRQEVMNNVRNFIAEQRAKEPNFDKIGEMMNTEYLNMPYNQAAIIAPVVEAARKGNLTQGQANILGQYYEICRKKLYAQINKTSVTPKPIVPKVENRGTGASAPQTVDYAKMLREASYRDKSKVLAAWLRSAKQ